jgi:hypothetical protein
MKRKLFLALLLSLVMTTVFALSGCGTAPGAAEGAPVGSAAGNTGGNPAAGGSDFARYTAASEALAKADSVSMDITSETSMGLGDDAYNMMMTGSVKQIRKSATELEMAMELSINVAGQPLTTTSYFKDGYMYTDTMGSKYKMATPIDDALNKSNMQAAQFDESMIINSSSEKTADGTQLNFIVAGSALSAMVGDQLGGLTGSGDTPAMSFGDATISALIDKAGNLKAYSVELTFGPADETDAGVATMKVSMQNIQFGGVTIDFPADLDSYMEL